MPASLPPYITSGASSRAHHSFLVRLHGAESVQEEEDVIEAEVARMRAAMTAKGKGAMKDQAVVDNLIILLHCLATRTRLAASRYPHSQPPRPGVAPTRGPGAARRSGGEDGSSSDTNSQTDRPGRRHLGSTGRRDKGKGTAGTSGSARLDKGAREDMSWALLPALHLAEGARTLAHRRIGYLFLAEVLRPDDELNLLLINTLRKDLTSNDVASMLLALNVIVTLPTRDLAPAVTPLLTSRHLLRHQESAIRHKVLLALISLYLPHTSTTAHAQSPFPLSMSKITRLLLSEEDSGVSTVLLRLIRKLIETRAHVIQTREEKQYLVEQILGVGFGASDGGVFLALEAFRAMGAVLLATIEPVRSISAEDVIEGDAAVMEMVEGVDEALSERLAAIEPDVLLGIGGAFILEQAQLLARLPPSALPRSTHYTLQMIRALLKPSVGPSTLARMADQREALVKHSPNNHVIALRCLSILPRQAWERALSEEDMAIIMAGLESEDDSVRRATLRLLKQVSNQLLRDTLTKIQTSLSSRTDLILPLDLPSRSSLEQRVIRGLQETASRGLEVIEIMYESERSVSGGHPSEVMDSADPEPVRRTPRERAQSMALHVAGLLDALEGDEEPNSSRREASQAAFWAEGSRRMLELLRDESPSFRAAFVQALRNATRDAASTGRYTLRTIKAAAVCEWLSSDNAAEVEATLKDEVNDALSCSNAEVAELAVTAAISASLLLQDDDAYAVLERLAAFVQAAVADRGSDLRPGTKKRLQQLHRVLTDAAVRAELQASLATRSLSDVLHVVDQVFARLHEHAAMPEAIPAGRRPADLSNSALRYDAYESPRGVRVSNRSARGSGALLTDENRPDTAHRAGSKMTRMVEHGGSAVLFDQDENMTARMGDMSIRKPILRRISDPFAQ